MPLSIPHTGLSPSMARFPNLLCSLIADQHVKALQPRMVETTRFGLIPFRSPLLRESRLISSPSGTEMFHFPEFAS